MNPTPVAEVNTNLTALERNSLEIALAVLRSDTDYGDFLNDWLHHYGTSVISANPPAPLLPELSFEEELKLVISDASKCVH